MKKKNKKNTKYYTNGRNIFGDKAKTHLIVLNKENAFEQMLDALCNLEDNEEFTFDSSCFKDSPEEFEEIMDKVDAFLRFKASLEHNEYYAM